MQLALRLLLQVAAQAPIADFTSDQQVGSAPLKIEFHDLSVGRVTSWAWDFGDGATSGERNPSHVYEREGAYTVTLDVNGRSGSHTISRPDFIRTVHSKIRRAELERPNVVLVVLDDVGVDRIGLFGETPPGVTAPCTPSIDALAAEGVLFRHAFANPYCSPTRAQILTGRHGFRTGVGYLIDHSSQHAGLSVSLETTLPEVLLGYDSSAVGKWHLSNPTANGIQHPLDSGFRFFAGSMFNLSVPPVDFGSGALDCSPNGALGYYSWVKVSDPFQSGQLEQSCSTRYATTDTVDDALDRAQAMSWPWFLQVSLNGTHMPFELPPMSLCPAPGSCGLQYCQQGSASPAEISNAMLEALDRELGRMLDGIRQTDPNAYVIVIGDNGSDAASSLGPAGGCFGPDRSKGTLYQGGIRVPLIVTGPDVVAGTCDELVSAVDLFATIADLAHVPHQAQDSVSLLPYLRGRRQPLRTTVYSEIFSPNFVTPDGPGSQPFEPSTHSRAIQDQRFKLIRLTNGSGAGNEILFDLELDPCETIDLCPGPGLCNPAELTPEEAAGLQALRDELTALGVY